MANYTQVYSKKEITSFTRRLHYHLRHHSDEIYFQKIRGMCGFYDYGTGEITIDYRKDILATLIHEFLHHIYPNSCETEVQAHEKAVINSLSRQQVRNIIKILAGNL